MPKSKSDQYIENKILYVLNIFPKISPSMLQIGIGTGIAKSMWSDVLERLIVEGKVYRYQELTQSPSGKHQTQTVISLRPEHR